ncbi:MAG: hypothetical protein M5R41_06365 [Bacteroidia bacterium]|nr:hypothetical protein [Bacteroidia bacterium]
MTQHLRPASNLLEYHESIARSIHRTSCFRRGFRACLLLLGTVLIAQDLHAQDAGTAGLMVEDSRLLGAGTLELSTLYADRVLHGSFGLIVLPADGYAERSQVLSAGAAYGVTEHIDIMGELQWCAEYCAGAPREYSSGFGDLRMGMKMQLYEGAGDWNLSWVPSVSVPLEAAEGVAFGMDQLLVASVAARRVAGTLQAGVHYGYTRSPDPDLHLHVAGGIGYQLSAFIQPRVEAHFESAPGHGAEHNAATLMLGAVLAPTERLRLDVGVHTLAVGEQSWKDRTVLLRLVFAP